VEQVAEAVARALRRPATEKQTYEIGGADAVTLLELLDIIGTALGRRRVRKIHIPTGLVRPFARLFHPLPGFPVTPDQLRMLEENNTCDPRPFLTAFGLAPAPLVAGIHRMFA
jgi:NADH dehydrogenase